MKSSMLQAVGFQCLTHPRSRPPETPHMQPSNRPVLPVISSAELASNPQSVTHLSVRAKHLLQRGKDVQAVVAHVVHHKVVDALPPPLEHGGGEVLVQLRAVLVLDQARKAQLPDHYALHRLLPERLELEVVGLVVPQDRGGRDLVEGVKEAVEGKVFGLVRLPASVRVRRGRCHFHVGGKRGVRACRGEQRAGALCQPPNLLRLQDGARVDAAHCAALREASVDRGRVASLARWGESAARVFWAVVAETACHAGRLRAARDGEQHPAARELRALLGLAERHARQLSAVLDVWHAETLQRVVDHPFAAGAIA
mmetsp:Transcript_16449/g.35617  ORF Transcript_16449/g.35617 Transcript_16449/m.35617 type:complete len:312 (-) Transcript_16449:377-1312(-)